MVRTQVQLPDELYREAKRLAELATRNTKDFNGFGFDRIWDPTTPD
jgi:hypothetical protein